jgi:hypothetical protein
MKTGSAPGAGVTSFSNFNLAERALGPHENLTARR